MKLIDFLKDKVFPVKITGLGYGGGFYITLYGLNEEFKRFVGVNNDGHAFCIPTDNNEEWQLYAEPKKTDVKFDIGDIVSWCGVEGFVASIHTSLDNVSIISVCFDPFNTIHHRFLGDGKYCKWHVEPSLKLVRTVKKEDDE